MTSQAIEIAQYIIVLREKIARLETENEYLKRENELLRKQNELISQKVRCSNIYE